MVWWCLILLCTLSISVFSQPANDDCLAAIPISSGSSVNGDNTFATSDSYRWGDSCFDWGDNGVWYVFNSGPYNRVTLTTCNGPAFDTVIMLFTGDCPSSTLSCVDYNDDACPNNLSYLQAGIAPNTDYYVLVLGFTGFWAGPFTLEMTLDTAPPPNDDCYNANWLGDGDFINGFNFAATADGSSIYSTCPGVQDSNLSNGVWYIFDSGYNDAASISLCGNADFDVTVMLFMGSCDDNRLRCRSWNHNGCGGVGSKLDFVPISRGQTYYIYVAGWSSSDVGTFSMSLDLTSGSGAGGDPHILDTAGHLFEVPIEYAGKIMALYHDNDLHVNAHIKDQKLMFLNQIGILFKDPYTGEREHRIEARLVDEYPAFFFDGVQVHAHSSHGDLPDWLRVSDPFPRLGSGVLFELARFQTVELEVTSMFIIAGGHHPDYEGFLNIEVFRRSVAEANHGLLQWQPNHERDEADLSRYVRDSLF